MKVLAVTFVVLCLLVIIWSLCIAASEADRLLEHIEPEEQHHESSNSTT